LKYTHKEVESSDPPVVETAGKPLELNQNCILSRGGKSTQLPYLSESRLYYWSNITF